MRGALLTSSVSAENENPETAPIFPIQLLRECRAGVSVVWTTGLFVSHFRIGGLRFHADSRMASQLENMRNLLILLDI
jgi:hypothetical protein